MSSPLAYDAERDRSSKTGGAEKTAVWTLDVPLLGLRWKNDPAYSDVMVVTKDGLEVESALSAELDLIDGTLAFDDFEVRIADPDGSLGEDHRPEEHLIPLAVDAAMGRRAELTILRQ